jgi:hypothetical protein
LPVGETKNARGFPSRADPTRPLAHISGARKLADEGALRKLQRAAGLSIAGGRRPRYLTAVSRGYGDHMTTFDDRERGFEKKFVLDQEQEFKATVRRNRALAQWAAGLMGLEGPHIDEYARAVVKSDFEAPGDEDVLRKVFEDLKGAGVQVTEGEVRMKMAELMAQARESVRAGD